MQRIVLLVFMLVLSGAVSAKNCVSCLQLKPYAGVEYQYQHTKTNGAWLYTLPTNFDNWGVFVGNKFHKYFGLEFGYFSYLQNSQRIQNDVTEFNGQAVNPSTTITSNIKYQGLSLDASAYIPLDYRFNAFLTAGVVGVHPTVSISADGGSNLATALPNVHGKNSALLKLGGGAEYVEKFWGARARVFWLNTCSMRLNVTDATSSFAGLTSDAFGGSILVAVGLFLKL